MSEKRKHIEHLSASEFDDYLNEQLSDLEMNRIERHLLECEFCNEAMDGYSSAGELNIQDDVDDINKLLLERTNSGGKAFPFLRIAAIAISLIVLSFFTANYLFNELKRPQFTEHKTVKKENKQVETIKETKEEVNDKEGYSNAVPANDEAIELTDETETSPKLSFSVDNSIQDTESELIDADVFEIEDLEFDMTAESSESVAYGAPNQSVQAEEVQFNATVPSSDVTSTKVQNVNRKSKKSDSSISESVLDDTLLVRGKIVNEQQEAIPFAVISNKDKNSGTTSNLDGQYEIEATSGDKLEIEYIGYNSKEVIVSNVETIDVALSPGISLEEVVISETAKSQNSNAKPQVGKEAYDQYLESKLQYPEAAKAASIRGKVIVAFKVDEMGNLSDFKIIKSLGYGCDEEAIRLIKEGPAWISAFKDGKTISEEVKIKVTFK